MNFAILASPALLALVEFLKLESLKKCQAIENNAINLFFVYFPWIQLPYTDSKIFLQFKGSRYTDALITY